MNLKPLLWMLIRKMRLGSFTLQFHPKSGLRRIGWYRSFNNYMSTDNDGAPIPWYTYGAINFLDERLMASMTVFEYGSGNSTLWFSKRVKQIIGVEHNATWYQKISSLLSKKDMVVHRMLDEDYITEPLRYDKFDVVVIDGMDRVKCSKVAVKCLKKDGVIIWDDSDWERFNDGYEFLRNQGFSELKFFGLAPITFLTSQTSIFYRKLSNSMQI